MMRERPSPWWRPQPLGVRRAEGQAGLEGPRSGACVWASTRSAGKGGAPGSACQPCTGVPPLTLHISPLLCKALSRRPRNFRDLQRRPLLALQWGTALSIAHLFQVCLRGSCHTLGPLISGWLRPPADSVPTGCWSALLAART